MNILDTRDLIEERENHKQIILENWNEKFEDNPLDSYEDILQETEDSNVAMFLEYWDDEISEINQVNTLEDEVGSEFEYGVTLIEEDDFEEYCEELLIDCGYISKDFPTWIEIDWEATANNVRQDYSETEFRGTTYLYR